MCAKYIIMTYLKKDCCGGEADLLMPEKRESSNQVTLFPHLAFCDTVTSLFAVKFSLDSSKMSLLS